MESKLSKTESILKKYNQEHLLAFFDCLSYDEKEKLLNQILSINFELILDLYRNSFNDNDKNQTISAINHIEKNKLTLEQIEYYTSIGEMELKTGNFAVITMAGGQGTRLGYKGPKGTYELDTKPIKKSLFQIMCEDIKKANKKYNITIPWCIMTSEENDIPTKNFFENNSFFNYPRESIYFFIQNKLPVIDIEGKLILQEIYQIKQAANGNGNVFNSMKKSGILSILENKGIKWISYGGIDNVLLKNVDPLFLGLTISSGLEIGSKSIFKELPLENVAVYCKKDNKPSILDYDEITKELSNEKDTDGCYLYREANMLSHIISLNVTKKVSDIELPYHRTFKKNTYVNFEGMKQVPDKPNSFKFENFIFDAFSYFDDMLVLRVNKNEEFAPIKDFTGIYTPETALKKYENYYTV